MIQEHGDEIMENAGTETVTTPGDAAGTAGGGADRRARTGGLKARTGGVAGRAAGGKRKAPLGQRAAQLARGGDEAQPFRRRMLVRVYRILTRTPDDGSGMVAGTPFTKAGVAELMKQLRERANNEGAPGAKVAGNAIGFLKPSEAADDAVAGASVAKLQQVARLTAKFAPAN